MKKTILTLALGLFVGSGLHTFAAVETYEIDPVHSSVVFKIKHLGASNFYGFFEDVTGTLKVDPANLATAQLDVQIKPDSVYTRNEKRDQHLKGPDFLNTKEFGTMSFVSKKVEAIGDNNFTVQGDLTFRGQTKPVTVKAFKTGEGKSMKGQPLLGAEAILKFKRSEFGMNYMPEALSDEIEVVIALEAIKK